MQKRIFLLLAIFFTNLMFSSCKKEVQNLDIHVSGKVTDQNNKSVGFVIININRGEWGNFVGPVY